MPIKKKWLDMILSGEKKEEYRDIKPYWTCRFEKIFADGQKHCVRFRAGYSRECAYADCLVSLREDFGHEQWGAQRGKYYVLTIHEIASHY